MGALNLKYECPRRTFIRLNQKAAINAPVFLCDEQNAIRAAAAPTIKPATARLKRRIRTTDF